MSIVKGDELMVFKDNTAFAYATAHTLSMTADTIDINHKDAGVWGVSEIGKIKWEVTSENLYSDEDYTELSYLMSKRTPLYIAFAKVSNYDDDGLINCGGDVDAWQADSTYVQSGYALITSLSANANTGENATFSVTFTGSGPLSSPE